jgi:uncharacterized coiled-coil DUF342 family protein
VNKREEYALELKRKLDEWNAEIDQLEARARAAKEDARQRMGERLNTLRAKRVEAQTQVERIEGASGDSWEALKQGAERTWDELKDTLQRTREAFSEGLARK